MKKSIIFVVLMLLFCCVNINTFALENDELEKYAYEIASDHLRVLNKGFEIISSTPLYDLADKQSGVWYHLEDEEHNKGYIIVSAVDEVLEITEFSIHNDLNLDLNGRIYYNGLTCYVKKLNGKFINSMTGKEVKNRYVAKPVDYNKVSVTRKILKNQASYSLSSVNETWLNHSLDPIDQHSASSDGIKKCCQTSAAMIIQYYKKYVSGYSSITNQSGGGLIDEISNYIPLTNGVTTVYNLRTGLSNYISQKGFNNTVESRTCDLNNDTLPMDYINTIATDISNNRPSIVIIGADANFFNGNNILQNKIGDEIYYSDELHALTVVGTWSYNGNDYMDVVDPWDATYKSIKWDPVNYAARPYFAVYACIRVVIR